MEPYGILLLGTILQKEGHQIQIVDIFPENKNIFIEHIRQFEPDLIGFSIETPAYYRVKEINDDLMTICPNAIRCAGGAHPTAVPDQTLKDLQLDFVVIGEADITFPRVIAHISNQDSWHNVNGICYQNDANEIIRNAPGDTLEDLDKLPIIDRSLIPYHQFYFSAPGNIRGMFNDRSTQIMTSRGCPYDCTFCSSRIIFGKKMRRRTVDHVIKEINYLQNNFRIQTICFIDDTFTTQSRWVEEFCHQIIKRKIKVSWCCQSRADNLKSNLLKLMKQAGCVQIDIGIESGSPRVLKALKKGERLDTLEQAINEVKSAGLRALGTFVVGSPEEREEDLALTIEFIKKTRPTMSQYFTLIPYPGSELYQQALDSGWLVADGFDNTWSHKCSYSSPMEIHLNSKELLKWRGKLENLSSFRDNQAYVVGLIEHPKYFLLMLGAIITYFSPIWDSFLNSLKKKRIQIVVLEIYKRFNHFMLRRVLHKVGYLNNVRDI